MARPVRRVSVACCGPTETTITSVRLAGFLQAQGFFDGDLVERVHRHLDVGKIDAGTIRFHADLNVVVNYPLHGHEDLHRFAFLTLLGPVSRNLFCPTCPERPEGPLQAMETDFAFPRAARLADWRHGYAFFLQFQLSKLIEIPLFEITDVYVRVNSS
jgi:hypothetical protein